MLAIFALRPGSAFSGSISWDLSGPPSKPKIFEIILKGCFLGAARTTGAKAKTRNEALNIKRKLINVFDMMMACFYDLVNEVVNKQQATVERTSHVWDELYRYRYMLTDE
jgi:hypothetical protein